MTTVAQSTQSTRLLYKKGLNEDIGQNFNLNGPVRPTQSQSSEGRRLASAESPSKFLSVSIPPYSFSETEFLPYLIGSFHSQLPTELSIASVVNSLLSNVSKCAS